MYVVKTNPVCCIYVSYKMNNDTLMYKKTPPEREVIRVAGVLFLFSSVGHISCVDLWIKNNKAHLAVQ